MPPFFFALSHARDERRILEERSVADRFADAHEVLHHDAAGAEVQVSDFAVAHLSLGKPDRAAGRLEQRPRVSRDERVPGRGVRQRDGVALALGAISPAVEHDEHDRAGVTALGTVHWIEDESDEPEIYLRRAFDAAERNDHKWVD